MHFGPPVAWLAVPAPAGRAVEFAGANPELVAAVVGVVVVAALVVAAVLRRVRRSPGRKLLSTLRGRESVAVLVHPNPDPDAMGSAMAVATLADHVDTAATIYYPGEIRHPENRAFRTVLDVDLEHVEARRDLPDDDVVLVDHNVPRGFQGAGDVDPVAVVDHHPGDGAASGHTEVRPEYGACASILTEYLADLDADLVGPDESADDADGRLAVPTGVATGMMYGILSDTNHLTNGCSGAEFEASATLHPATDPDRLDRIRNPRVDAETLEVKARAITEREVDPPYAVSDVGSVDNVDAIPQAASELVDLDTVTAVVVAGDDGDTIHLSGRSRDDRVHMGEVMQDVVEAIPMASGGGHARMGGAQIDLEHMRGIGPGNGVTRTELRSHLFAAMAGRELPASGASE
ncbi:MAG: bifunctional oligoribonuclease/PAP phosphatase NrnA [Halobacteriales archaeon]